MRKSGIDLFSRMLLELYRASTDLPMEAFQDHALKTVKAAIPFESCMWGSASFTEDGLDIHTIHLHNKSPEMLVEYAEVKHLDTAAASMVGVPAATQAFHAPSWFKDTETASLRDFLRRHEQQNLIITSTTAEQTGLVQWLTLFRVDADQFYSPDEVEMVAGLASHLMQSLAQNRSRHLARDESGAVSACEALIADARGVVYHATPGCEALLRDEWSHRRAGRLPDQLQQAAARGEARFMGRSLVAETQVRNDLLFVRLRRRGVIDSLSPREMEVARVMAQGHSHKEAARQLGRAPATVRNQLQAAYRKLDVQSIGALGNILRQG